MATTKTSINMNWFFFTSVILMVAKLAGFFPYSWWIVAAPALVSVGLGVVLLVIVALTAAYFLDK